MTKRQAKKQVSDPMAKRRFRVKFETEVVIEVEQRVLDRVDDEWRKTFYDIGTTTEVAAHIAYNLVINGTSLDHLDGFADLPKEAAKIVEEDPWETEATLE